MGNSDLREKCGVFGIVGSASDLQYCILGMRTLQHRGHESAGFAVIDDGELRVHHNAGLINEGAVLSSLGVGCEKRRGSIGHVRYSTSGEKFELSNVQPIVMEIGGQMVAIAHNGNFTNAITLRSQLVSEGVVFNTTMDSEVLAVLMARSDADSLLGRLQGALNIIEGAYSLVVLSADGIIGVRDRFAIRPLILGVMDSSYVLASESCALDAIGASFVRDIAGGEIVVLNANGSVDSFYLPDPKPGRHCIFEYVYFSRPDSIVDGVSVYLMRKAVGRQLGLKHPVAGADIVVPIPDSSVAAALGYAEACGLPFELGVIRNNYITRTFIQPSSERAASLCIKHNVNRAIVEGKSVILIDDSLVRGNTARGIVAQMRDFGAREVHMRIASPPVKNCCYYGIDTPDINHLVSARLSCEELARMLHLDSLAFADIDDLYMSTIGVRRDDASPQFCDACFTGKYPIPVADLELSGAQDVGSLLVVDGHIGDVGLECASSISVANGDLFDLSLLRFDRVFDEEFLRYVLNIDHDKCYGVHIFVNDAVKELMCSSGMAGGELDDFMRHCAVVRADNIVGVLGGMEQYSKICLIVRSSCVSVDGASYNLAPGSELSWKVH